MEVIQTQFLRIVRLRGHRYMFLGLWISFDAFFLLAFIVRAWESAKLETLASAGAVLGFGVLFISFTLGFLVVFRINSMQAERIALLREMRTQSDYSIPDSAAAGPSEPAGGARARSDKFPFLPPTSPADDADRTMPTPWLDGSQG